MQCVLQSLRDAFDPSGELAPAPNFQIHALSSLFFRNKAAYIVGRIINGEARHRHLVELNTIGQTVNVCSTTIVRDAWARGQELTVHGWTYGVHDGRLRDMGLMIGAADEVEPVYRSCIDGVARGSMRMDHG